MIINQSVLKKMLGLSFVGLGDKGLDSTTQNFLIYKLGDKLGVRATNRHIFISTNFTDPSYKDKDDVKILVSGKEFYSFVDSHDEIPMDVYTDDNVLKIDSGSESACFQYENLDPKYPSFPSLKEAQKVTSYDTSLLVQGLNFVLFHVVESSPSPKETIIQLRDKNLVGGTQSSLACWTSEQLEGSFVIKAINVRPIIQFLKNCGQDSVDFYETDNHLFFVLEGKDFIACEKLEDSLQVPNIEGGMQKLSYSTKCSFLKKPLILALKRLKHTIDDNNFDIDLKFGTNYSEKGLRVVFKNSVGHESTCDLDCEIKDDSDDQNICVKLDCKEFQETLAYYTQDTISLEVIRSNKLIRLLDSDLDDNFNSQTIVKTQRVFK